MSRTVLPLGPEQLLRDAVRAATQSLRAAPADETAVWVLPAGTISLSRGIEFGAPGHDLRIEGQGTTIEVRDASGAGGQPAAAVRVVGRRVACSGLRVRAAATGALIGVDVAAETAILSGIECRELRADSVTGLRLRGSRVRLAGLDVRELAARTGAAIGADVEATGRLEARDLQLHRISGDTVTGARLVGPTGVVATVSCSDLRPQAAGDAALVTVSVSEALEISGLSAVRPIGDLDPLADLAAAQAALVASPPGTHHTWLLPGTAINLPAGQAFGDPDHGLALRGRRTGAGFTELRIGAGAAIAGDLVGLELTGTEVSLGEVGLAAECTGELTGLRIRTARADVEDLALHGLRGSSVLGLDLDSPPDGQASVVDLAVTDVVADAGDATGARIGAARLVVTHAGITGITAPGRAAGLDVAATSSLAASSIQVSEVSGRQAQGAVLRATGAPDAKAPAELSALDVRVGTVTAATEDALGLAVLSSGDAALFGATVEQVAGARATGVLLAAAGEATWESGSITDVRGLAGGAAGARVLARSGPSLVRCHDLRIEAVGATDPGASAQPPGTWLDLAGSAPPLGVPDWLAAATSTAALAGLPAPGTPGHAEEAVGLAVVAPAEAATADTPGAVEVSGCVLHRISGTVLQVDAGGRPVAVRGVQAWSGVRGGWIDGEDVLLAQLTWQRHHTGIELGPAMTELVDVLVTDIETGLPVVGGDPGDTAAGAFTGRHEAGAPGGSQFRLAALELAVPADLDADAELVELYRDPGPLDPLPPEVLAGDVVAPAEVDLRLPSGSPLHERAVRVPGDGDVPAFLGAWPDAAAGCTLRDPLAGPAPAPEPPARPGPLVDYLARDARSLLAVMLERARVTMPDWDPTTPADQTRMLLELLANRLDRLSYKQEVALAEGYFGSARLRRSVEDHARLVDYQPDPGLSATAMLQFDISEPLTGPLTGPLTIPVDTVVVNRDPEVEAVVFTTEADLEVRPELASVPLSAPVRRGATSAELEGSHDIGVGRWLVLAGVDPEHPELVDPARPAHVVRVVDCEPAGSVTLVRWDFRRAAPVSFEPGATRVLGNVVPAHHGMPVAPLGLGAPGWGALGEVLRPWREQVSLDVDNSSGTVRSIRLPHGPVSWQAAGWPFPGEEAARTGRPRLAVTVDGEPWTLVDSLATSSPFDEHVTLRPAEEEGADLCTGNGTNGAALPRGRVRVEVDTRIGIGARANVGAGVLTQVLAFGELADLPGVLPDIPDREQVLLGAVRVTNPLPAVGGRDPETMARVRARAPLAGRSGLAAVVPADYERLLGERPEVAGVRARYRRAGVRDVVRVTTLLAAEDAMSAAGEAGTAERLRRWIALRERAERLRLLGTDVELVPPAFVPLDLDISVDAEPTAAAETVRVQVLEALAGPGGLFTPARGSLGGDVHIDAVYRRVCEVPGVTSARVRRLRRLVAGAPEHALDGVLPVADHEVAVLRDPLRRAHRDGVITVTVCGGVA